MPTEIVLPKLGNTVESSIIVEWLKQPGDAVTEGDVLCEVETDKAVLSVESTASGTLLAVLYQPGDEVPVMTPIAIVGEPGEDVAGLTQPGEGAQMETPAAAPVETPGTTPAESPAAAERPAISPRARGLAGRHGVDLATLAGTGPGGRVIERDVQAALDAAPRLTPVARAMVASGGYAAPEQGTGPRGRVTSKDLQPAAPQSAPQAAALGADYEEFPVQGVRRVIAARMLESMQTTAQLTLNAAADARALLAYRARLKESPEPLGLRGVSVNDLLLYAVSRTLPEYPGLNAHFTGEAIRQFRAVHLGFAVDTPRGLLVPVIRDAASLSLRQLAGKAHALAEAAQTGRVNPDDLSGATFTVTNLGSLGIESFTPILDPPQVAILGVGSIQLRPVQIGEQVEFIPHIGLSLTINHQVVDGAPGARFLQSLGNYLSNFELMLAT